MRRWWISAVFVLVASVVTAVPGSADVSWQTVTVTADFHCTVRTSLAGVQIRTCVVVKGNEVQAVVAVANFGAEQVVVEAPHVRLLRNGAVVSEVGCGQIAFSSDTTRGCPGPKLPAACGTTVQTQAQVVLPNSSTGWDASPIHRLCG
jgi:hypothetical protein